jgi:hypothetical protein
MKQYECDIPAETSERLLNECVSMSEGLLSFFFTIVWELKMFWALQTPTSRNLNAGVNDEPTDAKTIDVIFLWVPLS